MKDAGFEWDNRPGARPRPTTPELRLADLDRDGVDAEIIYGCLMINDLIADGERRAWADRSTTTGPRTSPSAPTPTASSRSPIIPNNDPLEAAAEVRRCAKMGLRGGDLAFKRMSLPLYHHGWYPLWEAAAECRFPISFHSTGFKGLRAPDTPQMEQEYMIAVAARALGAVPARHHGSPGVADRLRRLREYPDFNFVLGESGVTWLPYVFDRLDTEYEDRAAPSAFP